MPTLILDQNVVVTIDVSGNQLVHANCSGIVQGSGVVQTSGHPVMFIADVTNHSSKLSTPQLGSICSAVQTQLDNEGAQFWGSTAKFNFGAKVSGHVQCGIFDTADQPGDLGWHDDNAGQVTIECFYLETLQDLAVTLSHEMMETIGDYTADKTIKAVDPSGNPCLYFQENCDPVESDFYQISGISVSNFATPAWFNLPMVPGTPDKRYDFMQKCTHNYEIRPGGYMEVSYDNGTNWTQIQERKFEQFSNSRKRVRENWKNAHFAVENPAT